MSAGVRVRERTPPVDMRAPTARGLAGVFAVVLAPLLLLPFGARADVIEMPPSCPEGSRDAFCHGPPTCAPRGCVSSTDCDPGEVCAIRSLCLETHTCFPSSLVSHVLGPCDASNACPSGAACRAEFVCAPGPMPVDAGRPDSGMDAGPAIDAGEMREHATYCGCRVGRRGGGAGALLLAIAVGALRARRYRS